MDGDAGADVARGFERGQNLLGRAGRSGEIERDELIVAGEILLAQARDVARILGSFCLPPAAIDRLRIAVGEHGPHAGIGERLHGGIGVLGRVVDVRPIEDAGDAAVDGTERTEVIAGIHVIRGVVGAECFLHDRNVVVERTIRQHVAQDALPHVPVRVDETGHYDHAGGIDHLGVGRGDIGPHCRDLAALDQHVRLLEVADCAVEREHATAFDENGSTGSRAAARLLRVRGIADRPCDGSSNGARGARLEKLAARRRC